LDVEKGDELLKVTNGVDGWIKAESNGVCGIVPDFEKFNTQPLIVYIASNQTQCRPRIVATPFHTCEPLMPGRTRSTPVLNFSETTTDRERRNSS
jgi:hypothetical protein